MNLIVFNEPPIDNNNYLLIDEESKEAVLIDCSAVDSGVTDALNKSGAKLKYILLTHGHFDHVAGIRPTDAKIVMHKNDLGILSLANQYLRMFGFPDITIPNIDLWKHSLKIEVPDMDWTILWTSDKINFSFDFKFANIYVCILI